MALFKATEQSREGAKAREIIKRADFTVNGVDGEPVYDLALLCTRIVLKNAVDGDKRSAFNCKVKALDGSRKTTTSATAYTYAKELYYNACTKHAQLRDYNADVQDLIQAGALYIYSSAVNDGDGLNAPELVSDTCRYINAYIRSLRSSKINYKYNYIEDWESEHGAIESEPLIINATADDRALVNRICEEYKLKPVQKNILIKISRGYEIAEIARLNGCSVQAIYKHKRVIENAIIKYYKAHGFNAELAVHNIK